MTRSPRARLVQSALALLALAFVVWVVAGGGAGLIGDVVASMFGAR